MTEHDRIEVPGPDDPWWTVGDIFALTYDAYARVGSGDEVASIATRARDVFDARSRPRSRRSEPVCSSSSAAGATSTPTPIKIRRPRPISTRS